MTLSWTRIRAMLLQEYYITRRSLEVILDLYFFSIVAILAFGMLSVFLAGRVSGPSAYYLLLGLTLWEVVRITQYSMSVSSLWNVWSHNLSNLFVTPLSLTEYLLAQMISSVLKAITAVAVIGVMVTVLFGLDLPRMGALNLAWYFVSLSIFAWALGLALLGLIFCFGTRIQALAWGVVFIFQPLCAAFFPVDRLPGPLQAIANAIPPTHVFEAARGNLADPAVAWSQVAWAFSLDVVYFGAGLWLFLWLIRRAQTTGQFAKNDV